MKEDGKGRLSHDNPFAATAGPATRGEIWSFGLRNPWRFSFDRATHDLYGDYCQGWVRSFRFVGGQPTDQRDWQTLRPGGNVTSFGQDAAGEIYVLTQQGGVYRIVTQP